MHDYTLLHYTLHSANQRGISEESVFSSLLLVKPLDIVPVSFFFFLLLGSESFQKLESLEFTEALDS